MTETEEITAESTSEFEIEGWKYAFYPKPDHYDANSWFRIVRDQLDAENKQIESILAAVEHVYDDPSNPMYRKVIKTIWGVEAKWR